MENTSSTIRPRPSKLRFAVWCVLLGLLFLGYYLLACKELPLVGSLVLMPLTPVLFGWAAVPTKSYPTGFRGVLLAGLILVSVVVFACLMVSGKMDEVLSSLLGRFILLLTWLMLILGRWQMLYRRA